LDFANQPLKLKKKRSHAGKLTHLIITLQDIGIFAREPLNKPETLPTCPGTRGGERRLSWCIFSNKGNNK